MNRFLRMAYGHSGTRSRRILVSVPPVESPPAPRWARLLLLIVWVAAPVLVSLYAIPKTTQQVRTVIDISRLEVKPPPPEPERPVIQEPKRLQPVEQQLQPSPQVQAVQQPQVQPTIALPAEVKPLAITRPVRERPAETVDYQPRIARERLRPSAEVTAPAAPRPRREAVAYEVPAASASIARPRGATGADAPAVSERVAPLRRAPSAQGPAVEGEASPRPIARKERPSAAVAAVDGNRVRIDAARGRAPASGTSGGGDTAVGIARGISLASLGICSSPQQEEDDIKAVLSVVGSRQSCTDEKGEFQFKATKRISSFNLMIYPATGRRPSNRCEELKNAYKCLKTH